MFDQLSDRFSAIFGRFSKGKLTAANIEEGLKEVRMALLEADVNLQVVKEFTDRVAAEALGEKVLQSITPTQQFIKVVHDELVRTMGGEGAFSLRKGRLALLLCGLQGSGKTTTAAKLALKFKKDYRFLLVSADVYRPAAMEQLKVLATGLGVAFYEPALKMKNPVDIVKKARRFAEENGYNGLIVDTAGRLHVDEAMMKELAEINRVAKFDEVFFVADSTAGQAIADTVRSFHGTVPISAVVLTKFDSDTRGGAALSVRSVTGKPIAFVGTGEKPEDLDLFYPERIASRILGKGDILTLIENTQNVMAQEEAERLESRLKKDQFNLEDFRDQIRKIRKMGPLAKVAELLPGGKAFKDNGMGDRELVKIEAIIGSMTVFERRNINVLGPSRRKRIARGSGTTILDVNRLLGKFNDMKKMMKRFTKHPEMLDQLAGEQGGEKLGPLLGEDLIRQ